MTQDETTTEEKRSRSYWGFVLGAFVILVLYALSVGPATLAARKGIITGRAVEAVYKPLGLVVGGSPLQRPFRIYLHFWLPDLYDKKGNVIAK